MSLHCTLYEVRDDKYMTKVFDRYGGAVGQGMATFLSTGNVTSSTGLDLMQVRWQARLGFPGSRLLLSRNVK